MNGSHLDLINSINKITSNAQFDVICRHVHGHQDKHCVYEQLDWWGQRNVDMDLLAKSLMYARRKSKEKNTGIAISDHEIFGVIINRTNISGGFINTIHDTI